MKQRYFNLYYVIAFDPIKILTQYASQNDGLNLNFLKDVNIVAKKMAKNGHKMAIYELHISSFFSYKIENKRKGNKL
jgi:1,4-alpha-glucan branching enzyme